MDTRLKSVLFYLLLHLTTKKILLLSITSCFFPLQALKFKDEKYAGILQLFSSYVSEDDVSQLTYYINVVVK